MVDGEVPLPWDYQRCGTWLASFGEKAVPARIGASTDSKFYIFGTRQLALKAK